MPAEETNSIKNTRSSLYFPERDCALLGQFIFSDPQSLYYMKITLGLGERILQVGPLFI